MISVESGYDNAGYCDDACDNDQDESGYDN